MNTDAAWDIIERVLDDRLPEVAATLRGPVTEADLDRLAATVGRELPDDLVTSLRRHDGQDNPTRLLDLFDHYTLLSAESMIATSRMRVEALGDDPDDFIGWMTPDKVRPIMNCRGWLQFAEAEAYGFVIDLDPLPAGSVGQILNLPVDGLTPEPEFDSYGDWLSQYAQKLDAGAFTIDDTLGLWLES